jgi:hypothetical protein
MIFKNYTEFGSINEGARSKFPAFKAGDFAIIGRDEYQEFAHKNNLSRNWETYSKYGTSRSQGVLCKIVEVNLEKKEYVAEFVDGIVKTVYRGRSSGSGYYLVPNGSNRNLSYLRVRQNQLTSEGVSEIQELLKKNEYQPGEKVSVKVSREKSVTREIQGVAIAKSIENKELTYVISGISNEVKASLIEKEIEIDTPEAKELLAEEIARTLKTKVDKISGTGLNQEFIFDIHKLEGKSLINGIMFFESEESRTKFCEDLKKFIDKRLDSNLQKVMNGGEASTVEVINISSSMSRWYRGSITADKIVQAARNLGINVKAFLEKKRGQIAGRKFNI